MHHRETLTPAQRAALRDYAAGCEVPELRAGVFAFRNRERVISALIRKGFISADMIITDAGRAAAAQR